MRTWQVGICIVIVASSHKHIVPTFKHLIKQINLNISYHSILKTIVTSVSTIWYLSTLIQPLDISCTVRRGMIQAAQRLTNMRKLLIFCLHLVPQIGLQAFWRYPNSMKHFNNLSDLKFHSCELVCWKSNCRHCFSCILCRHSTTSITAFHRSHISILCFPWPCRNDN